MDSSESSNNQTPVSELNNTSSTSTAAAIPVIVPVPVVNILDNLSQLELRKRLELNKIELKKSLDKKKRIDKELINLENSIYAFEGSYLSDSLLPTTITTTGATGTTTSNNNVHFGNIIRGYDSYLKAPPAGGGGGERKRNNNSTNANGGRGEGEVRDGERIFSRSSATHQKAVELRTAEVPEVNSASEEESTPVVSGPDSVLRGRILELRWSESVTPEGKSSLAGGGGKDEEVIGPIVLPTTRIIGFALGIVVEEWKKGIESRS